MNIDKRVKGMKFDATEDTAHRPVEVTFDACSGRVYVRVSILGAWLTTDGLDGLIEALTEWRDRHKERTRAKARRTVAKETK